MEIKDLKSLVKALALADEFTVRQSDEGYVIKGKWSNLDEWEHFDFKVREEGEELVIEEVPENRCFKCGEVLMTTYLDEFAEGYYRAVAVCSCGEHYYL